LSGDLGADAGPGQQARSGSSGQFIQNGVEFADLITERLVSASQGTQREFSRRCRGGMVRSGAQTRQRLDQADGSQRFIC
jgi:hypothetical protein